MPQLVFIHGPGAGGCADAFEKQLRHFPGSVAPHLPGHLEGTRCPTIPAYVEWVRGWLWAQGMKKDLILCGYTLGSAISLQYGMDHPEEVLGLALTSLNVQAIQPPAGRLELRLKAAAGDKAAYNEWFEFQRQAMEFVEPEFRERLMERHRQVGLMSQYHDLANLFAFDAAGRLAELKPKLLVVGRATDAAGADNQELIHDAVPGSTFVRMSRGGHFPPTESPTEFNQILERFIATI